MDLTQSLNVSLQGPHRPSFQKICGATWDWPYNKTKRKTPLKRKDVKWPMILVRSLLFKKVADHVMSISYLEVIEIVIHAKMSHRNQRASRIFRKEEGKGMIL